MDNLKKYLNSLKRRDLALNTIRNYKYVIRKYLTKTNSLTTPKLKSYIQTALKKLAPTTCQENLNILTLYAKYCQIKIKKEMISRIIPKFQQRFFPTITLGELEQLKKVRFERNERIWQRNNLMLDFLLWTGIRVSELVNIRHSDWTGNSLRILGKGNKIRYVFVPGWLMDKMITCSLTN